MIFSSEKIKLSIYNGPDIAAAIVLSLAASIAIFTLQFL